MPYTFIIANLLYVYDLYYTYIVDRNCKCFMLSYNCYISINIICQKTIYYLYKHKNKYTFVISNQCNHCIRRGCITRNSDITNKYK